MPLAANCSHYHYLHPDPSGRTVGDGMIIEMCPCYCGAAIGDQHTLLSSPKMQGNFPMTELINISCFTLCHHLDEVRFGCLERTVGDRLPLRTFRHITRPSGRSQSGSLKVNSISRGRISSGSSFVVGMLLLPFWALTKPGLDAVQRFSRCSSLPLHSNSNPWY